MAPSAYGSSSAWRSHAFGISFEADFELAAVPQHDRANGAGSEPTRFRLAQTARELPSFPEDGARRVEELRVADRIGLAIDEHAERGYRLETESYGSYRLSRDGMSGVCAPADLEAWRRDRFLIARVLPLAATLRGLEVFHASSVAFADGAAAVVGSSHAGKSSVAIQMVLRGGKLLTDDLLALERAPDGSVIAHPGAALVGVRHDEYRLLEPDDRERLGRFDDRGDKVYLLGERAERASRLRAVYFLDRAGEAHELLVERLPAPDPRMLLGSSFFSHLELTPRRLTNQLDVCAAIARTCEAFAVRVPAGVTAAAVGERVSRNFASELAGTGR